MSKQTHIPFRDRPARYQIAERRTIKASIDADGRLGTDYEEVPWEEANLVSSRVQGKHGEADLKPEWRRHLPVFDIDVNSFYVETATDGHGHLYINRPTPWPEYIGLLTHMADLGLVDKWWVKKCEMNGEAFVRRPGIAKPAHLLGVSEYKDAFE